MKLLAGLFLGAIGVALLIAGVSGSAQQLWTSIFGKGYRVTGSRLLPLISGNSSGSLSAAGGTVSTTPGQPSTFPDGNPIPGTEPKAGAPGTAGNPTQDAYQSRSFGGVNTLTGSGLYA